MNDFMIWGHKATSMFDVWSIEHVVMGLSVGAFCTKLGRLTVNRVLALEGNTEKLEKLITILFLLALAFYWEVLEHYLETGLMGPSVQHWFAGVEHWSNRLVSDNAMILIGYGLYARYKGLEWPARLFSIVWLGTHIFIFPNSMYLHDIY